MKRLKSNTLIAASMVLLSILFFAAQLFMFHDSRETGFLFLQDLAFLPINVLLVTWVLDRILKNREKQERLQQTYIVISAFFSEIGVKLLTELNPHIQQLDQIKSMLDIKPSWTDKEFKSAADQANGFKIEAHAREESLMRLTAQLSEKKAYVVEMFNNPNLLEHDKFTSMLWAVYHLIDELQGREELANLPDSDLKHLSIDMERAYGLLIAEWLLYMRHLKNSFPYLFSLAVRKNPFNEQASILIK